jgi:hypothetical protein
LYPELLAKKNFYYSILSKDHSTVHLSQCAMTFWDIAGLKKVTLLKNFSLGSAMAA